MKASKFSEAQKAFILKQGADGVPGRHAIGCAATSVIRERSGSTRGRISAA